MINKIKKLLSLLKNKKYQFAHKRLNTTNDEEYARNLKKVMNLLAYTKKSEVSYSGTQFNLGYHSFTLDGHTFRGQRDPKARFKDLPISFNGLSVLDIGCNQGGMLYAFRNQIKHGIGIDYDSRMINAANKIKSYSGLNNIDYYVFNLETENLQYLTDFLPEDKVDVVLLLSVCMWIKNWKEVVDFSASVAPKMVFESNGKPHQQEEQVAYLQKAYANVKLIHEKSEDDPSQKMRKLYYCNN